MTIFLPSDKMAIYPYIGEVSIFQLSGNVVIFQAGDKMAISPFSGEMVIYRILSIFCPFFR